MKRLVKTARYGLSPDYKELWPEFPEPQDDEERGIYSKFYNDIVREMNETIEKMKTVYSDAIEQYKDELDAVINSINDDSIKRNYNAYDEFMDIAENQYYEGVYENKYLKLFKLRDKIISNVETSENSEGKKLKRYLLDLRKEASQKMYINDYDEIVNIYDRYPVMIDEIKRYIRKHLLNRPLVKPEKKSDEEERGYRTEFRLIKVDKDGNREQIPSFDAQYPEPAKTVKEYLNQFSNEFIQDLNRIDGLNITTLNFDVFDDCRSVLTRMTGKFNNAKADELILDYILKQFKEGVGTDLEKIPVPFKFTKNYKDKTFYVKLYPERLIFMRKRWF